MNAVLTLALNIEEGLGHWSQVKAAIDLSRPSYTQMPWYDRAYGNENEWVDQAKAEFCAAYARHPA
jgi:hypothetical protein